MKYVVRYAALAMATLSGITFLSGLLRLLVTYSTYHRVAPSALGPFERLCTGVACLGFGRVYQLLGRSKSNAASRTQTEIELVYVGFMFAWFFFIFMVHKMNLPERSASSRRLLAFVLATAVVVWTGFVMRKTFFKKSVDALAVSDGEALRRWKGAHFIGFTHAMSIAIFGAILRFVGSSWYVAGIFFGLGLGFLFLWRPRQMAASGWVNLPG